MSDDKKTVEEIRKRFSPEDAKAFDTMIGKADFQSRIALVITTITAKLSAIERALTQPTVDSNGKKKDPIISIGTLDEIQREVIVEMDSITREQAGKENLGKEQRPDPLTSFEGTTEKGAQAEKANKPSADEAE